jgi:peptidyl-tRNA hydrolase, PTH1 family
MKVIVGIGNPGREYEHTRHNVGWWVIDHLAGVWRFDGWKRDGEAHVSTGMMGSTRVRLIKPQTYVNLSGQVLRPYTRRPFWSAATDLMVVVDEVALPLGTYRLRARGSAGGHNGLKSVEAALDSREYPRLRVGVGYPDGQRPPGDLSNYVLGRFGKAEAQVVVDLLPGITDAIEVWMREGIDKAMAAHNRKALRDEEQAE